MAKVARATVSGVPRVFNLAGPPAERAVCCVGDSLVATTWPTELGTLLSAPVFNAGRGGWASTDVAVRQGGVDVAVTVPSDTLPGSGTVTVTKTSPTSSFRTDSTGVTYSWVGTLAGVPGTLVHTVAGSDGGWTFTRTTAGSATACPPGSLFHCTELDGYRTRIQVLWAGRNNLNPGPVNFDADPIRDYAAMTARIATGRKRAVVCSILNTSGEPAGSTNHGRIATLNATLAATYRGRYLDLRRHLIDNGLTAAGITPTTQDLADIGNDIVPTSLRGDQLHPNTAGNTVIAGAVAAKLLALGWV